MHTTIRLHCRTCGTVYAKPVDAFAACPSCDGVDLELDNEWERDNGATASGRVKA